jgi:hypothetical protein
MPGVVGLPISNALLTEHFDLPCTSSLSVHDQREDAALSRRRAVRLAILGRRPKTLSWRQGYGLLVVQLHPL